MSANAELERLTATTKANQERLARFAKILHVAFEMKRAMAPAGTRSGSAACPQCGGAIEGVLLGRKDHLHAACTTPGCDVRIME